MTKETLIKLYGFNLRVIEENLEGISHEESLCQPPAGGNCLNWVQGHIVATRNAIMKVIGEKPVWPEDVAARYKRGSEPITAAEQAHPLEEMKNDLRASQATLLGKLEQMSVEDLETPMEDSTIYDQLAVLQFHEAYHAGQLGVLRRLLGKSGAIR